MALTVWLVDKSALIRIPHSADASVWSARTHARIDRGSLRITTITRLEIGYSARSGDELRAGATTLPIVLMPIEPLTPLIEARAIDVQQQLADRGHHRAPSIPDLLIAATAELAGLTVLHPDKDFDLIASVTGQPTERVMPPT